MLARNTLTLTLSALACALSCSCSRHAATPAAAPPAPAKAALAPAKPPEPPAAPAVSVPPVTPVQVAQAEGITLTENSDGSVVLKTTSIWNDVLDTTYQTCDYYRGAMPVLKRQLSKDRIKLLDRVCVKRKKKK